MLGVSTRFLPLLIAYLLALVNSTSGIGQANCLQNVVNLGGASSRSWGLPSRSGWKIVRCASIFLFLNRKISILSSAAEGEGPFVPQYSNWRSRRTAGIVKCTWITV